MAADKPEKAETPLEPSGRVFSWFALAAIALVFVRAAPLATAYARKVAGLHGTASLAVLAVAGLAGLVALWFLILEHPKAAGLGLAGAAIGLLITSGNFVAALISAPILAATLLLGDAVLQLLRGEPAGEGDLSVAFAAGMATLGTLLLVLGMGGMLNRGTLVSGALLLGVRRRRRAPVLVRSLRESLSAPRGDAPPSVEAAWLAGAGVLALAVWATALAPDFSWDAMIYHLPLVRDIAQMRAVEANPSLLPYSQFWRIHETFLALGLIFGDERVVRLLHVAVGVGGFAAALSLARRAGAGAARPLVLVALLGAPFVCYQLRATYVDWPATFLVTAAASEIAGCALERRRLRSGAFLLGGAMMVKVFALCAVPALGLLAVWKARPTRREVLAGAMCAALLPLPWTLWSQTFNGFFLAPYASTIRNDLRERTDDAFVAGSSGAAAGLRTLGNLVRLPYDMGSSQSSPHSPRAHSASAHSPSAPNKRSRKATYLGRPAPPQMTQVGAGMVRIAPIYACPFARCRTASTNSSAASAAHRPNHAMAAPSIP